MDRSHLRAELKRQGLLPRGRGRLLVSHGMLQLRIGEHYYSLGVRADAPLLEICKALHRLREAEAAAPITPERWKALRSNLKSREAISTINTLEGVYALVLADKREEAVSEATVRSRYLPTLRRMYEHPSGAPWAVQTIRDALEPLPPLGQTRRQMVGFLRQLSGRLGQEWDAILDRSANQGKRINRRAKDFYPDDRIEAMLKTQLEPSWKRVLLSLVLFGLRPWEVLVAEPCRVRPGMLWIPKGKKSSRGVNPPRSVPAYHPHWLEEHDFWNMVERHALPSVLCQPGSIRQAGSVITKALQAKGRGVLQAGEAAYGFRHSWVRRMHSHYNVSDSHGAIFAGHSLACHVRTYREWLPGMEDPYADPYR